MKKLLFILVASVLSFSCFAQSFSYNGLNYAVISETDKTCAVASNKSFSGDLVIPETADYEGTAYSVTSIRYDAFYGCRGLTSVTIPNSVTSIGASAFSDCSGLTSVIIGNSVTSIGKKAFANCSGLTSVTIPNSVTSIGESAFEGCSGLTSVTIPNSVTEIGDGAFDGCTSINEITIEDGDTTLELGYSGSSYLGQFGDCPLEKIYIGRNLSYSANSYFGYSPFANRPTLTEVTIGDKVTSLSTFLFWGCSRLTSVEIGNSVTSIGNSAFYECSGLTSVEIGNSVISIGGSAFHSCSGLTSVTIPNSVTSIGGNAFRDCSGLTSVEIGNSVTSIGNYAFYRCSGLTSLTIGNSVTSIGVYAFSDCSGLTSVTIPNSVTEIGQSAFSGCSGLTSLIIGNSVTSIGQYAFEGCSGLTRVDISDLEAWCKISFGSSYGNYSANPLNYAHHLYMNGDEITDLKIPKSVTEIGDGAFYGCSGLTSVTIPNSVTSIGESAFEGCSGLTSVTIPNSVTEIGDGAFKGCSGLTSVSIPNSVTKIRGEAFYGCSGLTTIRLECTNPPEVYSSFSNYTLPVLIIPDNTGMAYLNSGWYEFSQIEEANGSKIFFANDSFFKYRYVESSKEALLAQDASYKTMTSVSIPDRVVGKLNGEEVFYKVTSIGQNAFRDCSEITRLTLPGNLITIGNEAFNGCSGLTGDLVIPNTVTSIGAYAFYECSGLTSVEIGNSVTSIGKYAFLYCRGLKRVEISDLEAWCKISFEGWESNPLSNAQHLYMNGDEIRDLKIPNSVTSIGYAAFFGCSGLTSITIPNSVTSIGEDAFYNCDINSFSLEDGPETINFADHTIKTTSFYFGRNITGKLQISNLKRLEVGAFVNKVPANTFNNKSLTSVAINHGGEVVIEENAFSGCSNLSSLTLPEDVAEIGSGAFSGTALKNITVPGGIIGDNAFARCNLSNIVLGAGVEAIGEKAFDGSNAIENVYSTRITPPAAQDNTFSYYNAQVWVPEEAIDTYYNNTRCWYRFSGKPLPLVCPENLTVTGPATFSGKAGEQIQLTAAISPSNVTLDRVLWRSTNPAVATVDNNGLVTILNVSSSDDVEKDASKPVATCQIIASTLYEDSPVAVVEIEVSEGTVTSVNIVNSDDNTYQVSGYGNNDIHTLQGVCLKRNASQEDIDVLAPGIYIIGGRKVVIR